MSYRSLGLPNASQKAIDGIWLCDEPLFIMSRRFIWLPAWIWRWLTGFGDSTEIFLQTLRQRGISLNRLVFRNAGRAGSTGKCPLISGFGQVNCRLMDISAFLHLSTAQSLKNDKNLFLGSWGQDRIREN